jgi:hypothetical protein
LAANIGADLSGNELDILAALWAAQAGGTPALKLAEVHQRINDRRAGLGQAPIQPTTVSTYLRSMTDRGLLNQVTVEDAGPEGERQTYAVRVRGLVPTSRSPKTGYQAAHGPDVVLAKTLQALADAFPCDESRWKALLTFARALGMSEETAGDLEKWLKKRVASS